MSIAVVILFQVLQQMGVNENVITLSLSIPLILILGIPHGATDHVLHNFKEQGIISSRIRVKFIAPYLLKLICFAFIWYVTPTLSLAFFLAISSFHFGETQWTIARPDLEVPEIVRTILYCAWGASVIFAMFYLYPSNTLYFLKDLRFNLQTEHFRFLSLHIAGVGFAVWLSIAINHLSLRETAKHLIEFALILVLVASSNLLVGFSIFFALWHSFDAISLQLSGLTTSGNFQLRHFIASATPFSAISFAGIGLIAYLWYVSLLPISLHSLFIVLISLLTLPHFTEVSKFYARGFRWSSQPINTRTSNAN